MGFVNYSKLALILLLLPAAFAQSNAILIKPVPASHLAGAAGAMLVYAMGPGNNGSRTSRPRSDAFDRFSTRQAFIFWE